VGFSHLVAEVLALRRGGLCGLAALQPAPQNYGAPYLFFSSFKGAQSTEVGKRRAEKELWSIKTRIPLAPFKGGVAPSAPLKNLEEKT
jgi:hypothetical protein